jgi:hypothetical protein
MSIPGVSTDIGDAESVPVVIGANETFTVRANTQVGYWNPPILEQGAQQVIEPGAIFYPAGQQSGPGGSLTVRELDGSPTGAATELVFPNGSLSFAGDVVTITGLEGPQGPQGIQGIQGIQGPAGANGTNGTNGADGAPGAPGPNEVTTSTATNITGLLGGNGSTVVQVTALGNISLTGAIGSTANLPLITGADGVITTGSFGTTENTFCEGNDGRLSDARTPTAHTHPLSQIEQSSATTGQVATWNGTEWAPATVSGAGSIDSLLSPRYQEVRWGVGTSQIISGSGAAGASDGFLDLQSGSTANSRGARQSQTTNFINSPGAVDGRILSIWTRIRMSGAFLHVARTSTGKLWIKFGAGPGIAGDLTNRGMQLRVDDDQLVFGCHNGTLFESSPVAINTTSNANNIFFFDITRFGELLCFFNGSLVHTFPSSQTFTDSSLGVVSVVCEVQNFANAANHRFQISPIRILTE